MSIGVLSLFSASSIGDLKVEFDLNVAEIHYEIFILSGQVAPRLHQDFLLCCSRT